jgi:hypothetical protein
VVATRRDKAGFLAKQQPDQDIIDIYRLSPDLLGSAVAEAAALDKPGRLSAIVIPEYARAPDSAPTSDDFTVRHTIDDEPSTTKVPRAEVTAYGTVQTHWRPARHWGIDPGKNVAVWVRVKDDGEYLYNPDFTEARPATAPVLAERIDRLITEDLKALPQFRNG